LAFGSPRLVASAFQSQAPLLLEGGVLAFE
jgi:hypothetical protein